MAASAALVLAACGGESATDAASGGRPTLRVASIPIADAAPLQMGIAKGFFEQ